MKIHEGLVIRSKLDNFLEHYKSLGHAVKVYSVASSPLAPLVVVYETEEELKQKEAGR